MVRIYKTPEGLSHLLPPISFLDIPDVTINPPYFKKEKRNTKGIPVEPVPNSPTPKALSIGITCD